MRAIYCRQKWFRVKMWLMLATVEMRSKKINSRFKFYSLCFEYWIYNSIYIYFWNIQILCGTEFEWIVSADGHVPEGALSAGSQSDGEPLYVGRTHHEGSLIPGKIQQSHNCLYFPFGGGEHSATQYEVLVEKRSM